MAKDMRDVLGGGAGGGSRDDPSAGGLLAVAVGNTRTRLGLFVRGELREARALPNADPEQILAEARRLTSDLDEPPVVMASVHASFSQDLERRLHAALGTDVLRIGRDVPVGMRHTLDDASTLGQDRILCALAAYARAQQACVVIDAGTAITVDFVDGEGVFHGGAIAPGLHMMLAALHEKTSALPSLSPAPPDPAQGPFGRHTRHAMQLGVRYAAIGLVRYACERYADHYEAYPQIVATGGDAASLFEGDDLVEHIVPDLQLIGILEACKAALHLDEDGAGPAQGVDDEDDL